MSRSNASAYTRSRSRAGLRPRPNCATARTAVNVPVFDLADEPEFSCQSRNTRQASPAFLSRNRGGLFGGHLCRILPAPLAAVNRRAAHQNYQSGAVGDGDILSQRPLKESLAAATMGLSRSIGRGQARIGRGDVQAVRRSNGPKDEPVSRVGQESRSKRRPAIWIGGPSLAWGELVPPCILSLRTVPCPNR